MKYNKPEVVEIGTALVAVQSQFSKITNNYPDSPVLRTSVAYEADE